MSAVDQVPTSRRDTEEKRAELEAQMVAFAAAGGKVEEVPRGATGYKHVIRMTREDYKKHHRNVMDYFFADNGAKDRPRNGRGRYV
jgi:hypothetical protein